MHQGSCLCRAVRFEVAGELKPAGACHCSMCRKQSGHFSVTTEVTPSDLTVHGAETVTWFRSSETARRGFCGRCGSFLFWDPIGQDSIAVAMGAFEPPTATKLQNHIFVADKGDYYEIADGLPQKAQS